MSDGNKRNYTFYMKGSGEAQNKIDRRNRLEHARKNSRKNNITDVVHAHLESSDPLVVSHMKFGKKKKSDLTPAMKSLLILPAESDTDSDSGANSDSDWEFDN